MSLRGLKSKHLSSLVWLISTAMFGAIGFLLYYSNPESYRFLFTELEELISIQGGGDSGAYLLGGHALTENDMLGEHRWIFNLWPPGMVHLYALVISTGVPIVFAMFLISSATYGLVLTFLFFIIQKSLGIRVALFGTLFALLNPFAIISLGPGSVLYSDGLGASFLALAIMSWLVWMPSLLSGTGKSLTGYYGLVFALSSVLLVSLRWAMVPVIGLFWLAAGAASLNSRRVAKQGQDIPSPVGMFEFSKALIIAVMSALPWTLYVATVLHPPNPFWSVGTNYTWAHRWLRDEDLPGFLIAGNANWACDLNPEKCEVLRPLAIDGGLAYSVFRNEALTTAVSQPLGFLSTGLADFFRGFFSLPYTGVGSYSLWYLSAVSAVLILVALVASALRKNWLGPMGTALLLLPTLAVIAVFHIESRYLLPLHYYAFTVCVYLILEGSRQRFLPKVD